MSAWSQEELRKIAEADDLHISPFREDGQTYGTPTWIWSVAVDGGLYVRGYNGQQSTWYQAALKQKRGRIIAAGMTKEVAFEAVNGPINDRIDDAYREKYKGSPYLTPMISARARSAEKALDKRRGFGQRSCCRRYCLLRSMGQLGDFLQRLRLLERTRDPRKDRRRHESVQSIRLGKSDNRPR